MPLEELESFDTVGRFEGLVPRAAEHPREETAQRGLVVHDEDGIACGLERVLRLSHHAGPSRTCRTAAHNSSALNGLGRKATPWSGTP